MIELVLWFTLVVFTPDGLPKLDLPDTFTDKATCEKAVDLIRSAKFNNVIRVLDCQSVTVPLPKEVI